jgi:citrate lyase beta subunit
MFRLAGNRVVIPRTELTYPGISRDVLTDKNADSLKMSKSAAKAPVDHVMGDMEDACAFDLKGPPVRKALAEAFSTLDFGNKVVTWRPNNAKSAFFEQDMEYMMRHAVDKFDGIILPKSFSDDETRYACDVLTFCERAFGWSRTVQVEVLIETPPALLKADAIGDVLQRSGRGAGLVFGIADFSSFIGTPKIIDDQHLNFAYAKQQTVIAAKAHGLHAIDNVYIRLPQKTDPPETVKKIEQGLREKNQWSAAIGMDGTWVIHPGQAAIAAECYTPTDKETVDYKRVLEYAQAKGGGAIADPQTGEMIDDATLRIALTGLSKSAQAGKVTWDYLAAMNKRITELTGYDILKLGL